MEKGVRGFAQVDFAAALAGRMPALVALTGAGGKTTLLFKLAEAFARRGARVVATTTTRMFRPGETAWLKVREAASLDLALRQGAPPPGRALFAARPVPAGGDKLSGFPPEAVDAAFAKYRPDLLLVEADGAAGRPLKAPAGHEPVIPATTTLALALAGLSALYRPFGETTVFRGEEFALATGLHLGEEIRPEIFARLVRDGERGFFKNVPPEAARWLFFNQADAVEPRENAGSGIENLPEYSPGHFLEVAAAVRRGLVDGRGGLTDFFVGSLRRCGLACLAGRV